MHAIWNLLFDKDFMHAYKHGIKLQCADGVSRRIFPRFFTYSADYPKKYFLNAIEWKEAESSFRVLLATIKYLARHCCPRCEIRKQQIAALGTTADEQRRKHKRVDDQSRSIRVEAARTAIFQMGSGIKGKAVEDIMSQKSEVPTHVCISSLYSICAQIEGWPECLFTLS